MEQSFPTRSEALAILSACTLRAKPLPEFSPSGLHERLVKMTGAQERPSEHDVTEREARVEVESGLQLAESTLMLRRRAKAKPEHHPRPGAGRILLQGV